MEAAPGGQEAPAGGDDPQARIWRRVGLIATWCLGGFAVFLVVAVVGLYTLADVPRPEDLPQPQAAEIYYADGSLLAKIGTENRTIVPLSQVPDSMKWALISTEDRNFYSEPGFSIRGSLRAALSDLTGGDTQGGSGLTQQYVKNAYLSSQQTLTRKIKELAISVKLAREYSKDDILGFYLNTVYFGRGAYGIEAAAQTYFGVDSSKLTVAQSALLAGLLRAPSYYDPANNPQAAQARWQHGARQHGRHQAPHRRGRGGADLPGDAAGDRRQRARRDRARKG